VSLLLDLFLVPSECRSYWLLRAEPYQFAIITPSLVRGRPWFVRHQLFLDSTWTPIGVNPVV
jgi:hypothetical protein